MLKEKKTLPSGAMLELQSPALAQAKRLFKAVSAELLKVKVGSMDLGNLVASRTVKGPDGKDQVQHFLNPDADLNLDPFKDAIFALLSSDSVEDALHECMGCCLYRGERIKYPDTFEGDDNRPDYLPCALEVAKLALRPFWSNLGLKFSTGQKTSPPSQG